jgi:hypothetical protein
MMEMFPCVYKEIFVRVAFRCWTTSASASASASYSIPLGALLFRLLVGSWSKVLAAKRTWKAIISGFSFIVGIIYMYKTVVCNAVLHSPVALRALVRSLAVHACLSLRQSLKRSAASLDWGR